MRRILLIAMAICFAVSFLSILPAIGQDTNSSILPTIDQDAILLTPSELDNLLGSIALYPDPLLAQLLPAATFPDQLLQASQLIQLKGGAKLIDDQDWDVSVKAIAHYPSVINKMVNDPDWSDAVGQAYINQPEDVMKSIQRLRGRAKLLGYLSSSNEQDVITDSDVIMIVPAQPEYIYVPVYDPQVIYMVGRPHYNTTSLFISFGSGFSIGSWLNRDCDWHQHRVYYHGWQGNGWIQRSRNYVVVNNYIYVNNRYHDDDYRMIDRYKTNYNFDRQRQRSYEHRTQPKYKKQPGFHMPTRPDQKIRLYDLWKQHNDKDRPNTYNQHNNPRVINDRRDTREPVKANVINPWKTPKANNNGNRRPNSPNTWNKPRENNNRQNQNDIVRPDAPNSWNKPGANEDRQNQNDTVRPDTPNLNNNDPRRVNDRTNTSKPIKANVINPWNQPRVNNDRQNQNDTVRHDTPNLNNNNPRVVNDRTDTRKPIKANTINTWNEPRVNNNRQNQNDTIRHDTPNLNNNQPRVVNERKDTNETARANVINPWSAPRVNNERKSQSEIARPDTSSSSNKSKADNDKKGQEEKVKQDKPNSWGTRRSNR